MQVVLYLIVNTGNCLWCPLTRVM